MNAEGLLKELFNDECRPSMRWLRTQTKAKAIPHIRLGHLVFFDVEMVRAALVERNLVQGRFWARQQLAALAQERQQIGNSQGNGAA